MGNRERLFHRQGGIIRFESKYRLHDPREFSAVLQKKCASNSKFIEILVRPNNLGYARLGLIVARRVEKLAVKRNRVKRLLREQFRLCRQNLPAVDLVVRLRCPVTRDEMATMAEEAKMIMVQLPSCRA